MHHLTPLYRILPVCWKSDKFIWKLVFNAGSIQNIKFTFLEMLSFLGGSIHYASLRFKVSWTRRDLHRSWKGHFSSMILIGARPKPLHYLPYFLCPKCIPRHCVTLNNTHFNSLAKLAVFEEKCSHLGDHKHICRVCKRLKLVREQHWPVISFHVLSVSPGARLQ